MTRYQLDPKSLRTIRGFRERFASRFFLPGLNSVISTDYSGPVDQYMTVVHESGHALLAPTCVGAIISELHCLEMQIAREISVAHAAEFIKSNTLNDEEIEAAFFGVKNSEPRFDRGDFQGFDDNCNAFLQSDFFRDLTSLFRQVRARRYEIADNWNWVNEGYAIYREILITEFLNRELANISTDQQWLALLDWTSASDEEALRREFSTFYTRHEEKLKSYPIVGQRRGSKTASEARAVSFILDKFDTLGESSDPLLVALLASQVDYRGITVLDLPFSEFRKTVFSPKGSLGQLDSIIKFKTMVGVLLAGAANEPVESQMSILGNLSVSPGVENQKEEYPFSKWSQDRIWNSDIVREVKERHSLNFDRLPSIWPDQMLVPGKLPQVFDNPFFVIEDDVARAATVTIDGCVRECDDQTMYPHVQTRIDMHMFHQLTEMLMGEADRKGWLPPEDEIFE